MPDLSRENARRRLGLPPDGPSEEHMLRHQVQALESALAAERAKRLAAEAVIEQVRKSTTDLHAASRSEWVRDLQMTISSVSLPAYSMALAKLDTILATADLSALREHDAKVLEEAADAWPREQGKQFLRARAAEIRATP